MKSGDKNYEGEGFGYIIDGKKYGFYDNGPLMRNDWYLEYYVDSNGIIVTGYQEIDGKKYYFDANGKSLSGFQIVNGKQMYFGGDQWPIGTYQSFGWTWIGYHLYYFDPKTGEMQTSNRIIDGVSREFYPDGVLNYKSPIVIKYESGLIYAYDTTGAILNGWQTINGDTYYFGSYYYDNQARTGLQYLYDASDYSSYYFFFDDDGKLQKDKYIDNCYYDENGRQFTGWKKIGDDTYYYGPKMSTGVQKIDIDYYYFDAEGKLQTNLLIKLPTDDGENERYFYYGSDGKRFTGWLTLNDKKYYFAPERLTSIQLIDNDYYYFNVAVLEVTPIEAFVTRCYRLILNREPDEGGLQGWCETLANKTATAAQIINGFVSSDEYKNRNLSSGESVDILYNTMLNRAADEGGKAGWVDALGKGYTLQNIIDGFCGSPEFVGLCKDYGIEPGSVNAPAPADMSTPRGKIEAFVKRCYSLILSRDADQGGLQGWSDALESGAGQACQIIDGFVRSPEYINRNLDNGASVDILYKTMLNREPDPDGRAGWVDALGQGYTLQHIINGFCGSAEFTAICNDYGITAGTLSIASALVKREAITPEGDEAEAPVVYQGYNSEFINEEKIRAFVEHCYVAVFGREGDTEGVENYTKLILNGKKMPKKVAYEFIFSPEFQEKLPGNEEFIRILYRLYFDREPGAEELAGWVKMLEDGASLEEIVNGFAGSAEFKAIINGMKE